MSTELKAIPTLWQEIRATRFYGGAAAGACLQLTQMDRQSPETGYIQIPHADAKALGEFLIAFSEHPMEMEESE